MKYSIVEKYHSMSPYEDVKSQIDVAKNAMIFL